MKNYRQEQVYVIRWRPSQCLVDPIEEIILDLMDYDNFVARQPALIEKIGVIDQLSKLSGIPVQHISRTESRICVTKVGFSFWIFVGSLKSYLPLFLLLFYELFFFFFFFFFLTIIAKANNKLTNNKSI
uniref:Uncharacterized protein n=1 Tax=Amphimedon queenslandica TaxID=400682 RepID=A0A1X7T5H2_AMPQE